MRTGWLAVHYPLCILFNRHFWRQYLNDALVILGVPILAQAATVSFRATETLNVAESLQLINS